MNRSSLTLLGLLSTACVALAIAACVGDEPTGVPLDDGGSDGAGDDVTTGGDDAGGGDDATTDANGGGDGSSNDAAKEAGPSSFGLVKPSTFRLIRGTTKTLDVTVNRTAFPSDISVTLSGFPTGVSIPGSANKTFVLTAGQTVAHFPLAATVNADLGRATLHVVAASNGQPDQAFNFDVLVTDAPGTLDLTFGGTGLLTKAGIYGVRGLSIGADDSVTIAGSASPTVLARFSPAGVEDTAFESTAASNLPGPVNGVAERVLNSANPQVVIVGTDGSASGRYSVRVLNHDGSVDSSFATGQFLIMSSNTAAKAVAVDSQQRIVSVGVNTFTTAAPMGQRFTNTGTVDHAIGYPALPAPYTGMAYVPTSVAIGPNDDVWVGGTVGGGPTYAFVAHFNGNNLSADTNFGTGGIMVVGRSIDYSEGWTVAGFPTGEVGLGGYNGGHAGIFGTYKGAQVLAGDPDSGVLQIAYSTYTWGIRGLVTQPDGRILLAGSYGSNTKWHPFFERRFVDGGLDYIKDPDAGGPPRVDYAIGNQSEWDAIALASDGRIVVAGIDDSGWLIARYWL